MPPKPAATAKKASTTGAKAAPKAAPKATAKSTTKPAAKAAASKKPAAPSAPAAVEKKEPAPEPPKPITFTEINIKQLDKIVNDPDGTVKASGKWPVIVDDQGIPSRFLRHRDVNMLSVPDEQNMQPETIRKALIGSIKYGKPFILDMMEAEMYEFCKDQFDKILPGLLESILDKSIVDDTYRYMQIVKEEDGPEYENQYNYNIPGFSFIVTSQCAPNEELLRKSYPVKIV